MKILITIFVLLAAASAREGTTDDAADIKDIFDDLLEAEGVTVAPEDYEDRLAMFVINYLVGDDADDVDLDMMYSDEQLEHMNGVKLINGLQLETMEELQKREELEGKVVKVEKRKIYTDNTRRIVDAVSQGDCGNCYIHTVIAALEMAYAKTTGRRFKFSEQELTDCYFSGCDGGDFRLVPLTLKYLDKLSSRSAYGPYMADVMTCRGATTPDALKEIKIEGVVAVTPDTVEDAINAYGSVMTCMAWASKPDQPCYMRNYKRGTIADWDTFIPEQACAHAVLIVGYGPGFFIVRNSHGKSWGDNGHFRIRRTACGIQDMMAAIVVSSRASKGGLTSQGCPADKPHLCPAIHTCSAAGRCAKPISQEELEKEAVEEVEEVVKEVEEKVEERDLAAELELIDLEKREVRIPGEREKRDEESRKKRGKNNGRIPGKIVRMLAKRGVSAEDLADHFAERSDETENIEKRCADNSRYPCAMLKAQGRLNCKPPYNRICATSCGACGSIPKPKPKPSGETQGPCITPKIPHGTVSNQATMQPGEKLALTCDDGYTLTGGEAKCLIQDQLTNADKDARLTPECVKKGDEDLVGNGATYEGIKDSYKVGPMSFECDSWNKEVLRGIVTGVKGAEELAIGNHNYCRNPGGKMPVPYCLGTAPNDIGSIRFCFGHPGCDTCAGAVDDYGPSECNKPSNKKYCLFSDTQTQKRVEYVQARCKATCCAMAGC